MIKDITTDIRWKTPSLFHLFFHGRNDTGAHLSTAAICLVLQGSETGKVHGTILSYMDLNHPVWLGRLSANDRKTVFYKPCVLCSHVSTIPLNCTGSLPHLIFQATSKWPGCLGWGCDLSLFPCICAQATSRSQNCVSSCAFALLLWVQIRGASFPALAGWIPNHRSVCDQLSALMFSLTHLQVVKLKMSCRVTFALKVNGIYFSLLFK